jgi:SAM-dependent methyltransferase
MQLLPRYSLLFSNVDIKYSSYFPIHFSPSIQTEAYIYYHPTSEAQNIEDHVGEFGWNFEKQHFILKRMRPDKDALISIGGYGNDFITAENIFNNYKNPLTVEKMVSMDQNCGSYFREAKDPRYLALTKFDNFVKAQLLRQLEKSEWVIDAACGRGSDLFTWHGYQVKNLVCIDNDVKALEELNNRQQILGQPKAYVNVPPAPKSQALNIYTIHADLSGSTKDVYAAVEKIVQVPYVNGIAMNFAIHYILKSEENIANLFEIIDYYLKPGGLFIFTCFDGQKIWTLLQNAKQYDLNDDTGVKYSIKKLYGKEPLTVGQKISVIHPFSGGSYYEEYLVNIPKLLETFIKSGYRVLQNSSFGDWLSKFKYANPKIYNQLSKEDALYASLYSYVTVAKSL